MHVIKHKITYLNKTKRRQCFFTTKLTSVRLLGTLPNNNNRTTARTGAAAVRTTPFPSVVTQVVRNYGHHVDLEDMTKDMLMLFDKVDPSKVTMEAKLCADLGLDSLDIVEMTIALGDEFFIDVSDNEMDQLQKKIK